MVSSYSPHIKSYKTVYKVNESYDLLETSRGPEARFGIFLCL